MGNKNSTTRLQRCAVEPMDVQDPFKDYQDGQLKFTSSPRSCMSVDSYIGDSPLFNCADDLNQGTCVPWALDSPESQDYACVIYKQVELIRRAICEEFDVPRCHLAFLSSKKFWVLTSSGTLTPLVPFVPLTPLYATADNYLNNSENCFIVPNLSQDPTYASNPMVKHRPYCRFFAGVPIISALDNRHCLGVLSVVDFKPRESFTEQQKARLQNFASTIGALLQQNTLNRISISSAYFNQSAVSTPSLLIDVSTPEWQILKASDEWKAVTGVDVYTFNDHKGFLDLFMTESEASLEMLTVGMSKDSAALAAGAEPSCILPRSCIMTPADLHGASLQFAMAFRPADATSIATLIESGFNCCPGNIWKAEIHLRSQMPVKQDFSGLGILDTLLEEEEEEQESPVEALRLSSSSTATSVSDYYALPCCKYQPRRTDSGSPSHRSMASSVSSTKTTLAVVGGIYEIVLPPRLRNLHIGERIGHGSFGIVYKGQLGDSPVAIKLIQAPSEAVQGEMSVEEYEAICEVMIGTDVLHENVVKTLDWHYEQKSRLERVLIVQELCDRGSLLEAIECGILNDRKGKRDMRALLETALDIARGMQHVHWHNVLHADLSDTNILLNSADNYRGFTAKVSDFGISRMDGREESSHTIGTVSFMAPELLTEGLVSKPGDVYSFGTLLWEMYSNKRAWANSNFAQVIFAVTVKGDCLKLPDDCPAAYAELTQQCLAFDSNKRPTFDEIVRRLETMLAQSTE